jgi:ABC-type Mn2+/Zn2+ transport system permease subunit
MIRDFIQSWPLFAQSYLCGWLIGSLLAFVGVLVVARDQIFLGAAVSQASTLGVAAALWLAGLGVLGPGGGEAPGVFVGLMAVSFSLAAALATARGGETGRESREAVTGWIFLFSASLSVLIVSHSPLGLEEVHRLLSSSLIGATGADVWLFAGLNVVAVAVLAAFFRPILLSVLDPTVAAASGVKAGLWNMSTSAWLGLAVGLSIRVSGLIYTFGCLILPALVAKALCREIRTMFFAAPAIAVGTGLVGFGLANHFDFPAGQMAVVLLAFELALAWLVRGVRGWNRPRSDNPRTSSGGGSV